MHMMPIECLACLHIRYYKKFDIPEMDVLKLPLNDQALTWTHSNNTLIISYAKPHEIIQAVRKNLFLCAV